MFVEFVSLGSAVCVIIVNFFFSLSYISLCVIRVFFRCNFTVLIFCVCFVQKIYIFPWHFGWYISRCYSITHSHTRIQYVYNFFLLASIRVVFLIWSSSSLQSSSCANGLCCVSFILISFFYNFNFVFLYATKKTTNQRRQRKKKYTIEWYSIWVFESVQFYTEENGKFGSFFGVVCKNVFFVHSPVCDFFSLSLYERIFQLYSWFTPSICVFVCRRFYNSIILLSHEHRHVEI